MYGLVTLARITGTDRYATKARSLLDTLSAEAVTAGETHGVLNGTAGRLLALLAVADETGAPAARRLARRAGDRLLASVESEADLRGWRHPATDTVLTGFAHGTTGIATALCRLTDATGDGRYAETAATCLRSTDAVRHDACHTWADTRPGTYATYRDAWCYGRSGIGLGRLAASAAADVPPPDLSGLVTRLRELFPSDHLCCGNAGRAWFALAAGEQTGIDRYRTVGTQILDQMVRRTAPTEPFRTTWGMGHRSDPTLFHGEAGIGYTLLRATDPTLPAILVGE